MGTGWAVSVRSSPCRVPLHPRPNYRDGGRAKGPPTSTHTPHAVPAAGGPGRWSCSRRRPCPRRSTGCTETPWCSARDTSHSWGAQPGTRAGRELAPATPDAEPQGQATGPRNANRPPVSKAPTLFPEAPTVAWTDRPPPGARPLGLTEAPGPSGSPSASSQSCAPRWPEGRGTR